MLSSFFLGRRGTGLAMVASGDHLSALAVSQLVLSYGISKSFHNSRSFAAQCAALGLAPAIA